MTSDRDVEVIKDIPGFAVELRRLADALEQGSDYMIEIDGEEITIPTDAILSIAHEREDGEVELEFQITWSETSDDKDEDDDEDHEDDEEEDKAAAV